jgi:hypothetical protein
VGLHALWGGKPPGASKITKHGAWHSLAYGSGILALSSYLGCLWSSKAGGLESSGAHIVVEALGSTCVGMWASRSHSNCCRHGGSKPAGSRNSGACFPDMGSRRAIQWYSRSGVSKPAGSGSSGACLPSAGIQEPQELLQSWENKASRQWEPWSLHASTGFWENGTAADAGRGNQACWLAPSLTHGAAGALGPAYTGAPISLAFQSEVSRSCSRGEHGALSSCVCWETGLTTK